MCEFISCINRNKMEKQVNGKHTVQVYRLYSVHIAQCTVTVNRLYSDSVQIVQYKCTDCTVYNTLAKRKVRNVCLPVCRENGGTFLGTTWQNCSQNICNHYRLLLDCAGGQDASYSKFVDFLHRRIRWKKKCRSCLPLTNWIKTVDEVDDFDWGQPPPPPP